MGNWANRTLWVGDNLDIMRGMNDASVDLVYLDPPFNSKGEYSAPVGSEAAGAAFKDTWTFTDVDAAVHGEFAEKEPAVYSVVAAARAAHGKGMQAYLIMMGVRLLEIRRLMRPTASVYLHCDPTAGPYLRMLMDGVFGAGAFRNEVVWCYSNSGRAKRFFAKKHDTILFYGKSDATFWGDYRVPPSEDYLESHYRQTDGQGRRCRIRVDAGKERVYYPEDGVTCNDWWDIPCLNSQARERVGYPTQKPLALLDRIISASSNPGDTVLDPFCGCATTCVSAERLGREWVGIDLSPLAAELVKSRLSRTVGTDGVIDSVSVRFEPPRRTDQGVLAPARTHKHTLFGRQEGVCRGCKVSFPFRNLTVDHIVPRSRGGTDHIDNLQLLCGACNSVKGTGTQEEFRAKMRRVA